MIETPNDIKQLCHVLERLTNLVAISLIRVLNFYPANYTNEEITEICSRINRILRRSHSLRKIDFSFNYLRSRIAFLFNSITQPLEYLNLQDCRLDSNDITHLNTSQMLKLLKNCSELNLSMNDFSQSYMNLFNIIHNCVDLYCLSISYCQIPMEIICQQLVNHLASLPLKVICIQPFTPPPIHELIDIIHAFCAIKTLQKFSFLPSLYAFPGSNDFEREQTAMEVYQICSSVLEAKNRSDIEFMNIGS